MTRGRLVLIVSDENDNLHYHMSTEFNGGMYLTDDGHGPEIVNKYLSGDIKNVEDFYKYIRDFNMAHHGYDDEWLYGEINLEEWNGECKYKKFQCSECPYNWDNGDKSCTYTMNFHGVQDLLNIASYPYHSDYNYWLNLSDSCIEVLAGNGVVEIKPNGGAVFNYADFVETELDSGFIPANESCDFTSEAFVYQFMREHELTKEEAEEAYSNGITKISAIYDDLESFGENEALSFGVEDWIMNYMDMERFARDQIRNEESLYELESGRIVAAY